MNTITMNDSLTKLVYASVLAGLILAFANPMRSHPQPKAAPTHSAASALVATR
jgi:hypothetical protein